jgi:iodotyrosine deiodinase
VSIAKFLLSFGTIAADLEDDICVEDQDYNKMTSSLPEDLAHVPLKTYKRYSEDEMLQRSREYFAEMNNRRTLRFYSPEPVPIEVIRNIIQTAGEKVFSS